ncbi:cys-loop ligand-gated ion channel-like isoform X1 [Mytilus trossulus]|uniref:cys-loop ligand-gated ion channel-like isoform X1 n=1 Tax=Mytilus trossulus TaxID=6551 RepID=UPI00300795B1
MRRSEVFLVDYKRSQKSRLLISRKRQVFIKVSFLKIGEIDTLKENFSADVYIQSRWREPQLDKQAANSTDIDWKAYWDAKIKVQNVLSETRHDHWKVLQLENGEAFVIDKQRIKATFAENLELLLFPFDIQDLSVNVSTEHSEADVELLEEVKEISSVHTETFAKQQEWHLFEFVEFTPKVSTKEYANTKYKHPGLIISCNARRRAGFFVWNVLLIMTLISSLSIATFSVDRNKPQNRLQLSFTLVLTGVAFKFVANQTIPKISYLTQLDRYILGSMTFLYLVCIWHSIVVLISDEDDGNSADKWALVTFIILFSIFQIAFFVNVLIQGYRRWRHAKTIEEKYEEKYKNICGEKMSPKKKKSNPFRKMVTVGSIALSSKLL